MNPRFCRFPILAVVLLCPLPAAAGTQSTQRFTLLHTSDMHGHILPFDDIVNTPVDGSLAQVATVVERIRSGTDNPVLVLDSGDAIQGSPLELYAQVRWGLPSQTVEAMNHVGYSAMAIGNHEFNFGLEILRRAELQAGFPLLAANVVDEASGEPAFDPYTVVEAGAVRVGILGLVTPNVPGWEKPQNYAGLAFQTPPEAARRWLPVLREEERCDVVVVLAHTGFERDPSSGVPIERDEVDFGWRLAHIPGIDVLLTGHTHEEILPRELGHAVVAQPAAHARRVTRIDLDFEREGAGWRLASWTGETLKTDGVLPDDALSARFATIHERLARLLDTPVGHATGPVSIAGCRLRDCSAVDLMHAVQLEATGAELSLASALSDATPDLPPGPVTWRWIHGLYVYTNNLVVARLTGAQVRDILEHAARFYDGLECSSGGGCTLLTDPDQAIYNVDSLAGVSYRIDPTRPEGDRVRDLRHRGVPLDHHTVFTLAMNSYRAAGGGRFPHLADAEVVGSNSKEVTDLIGEYVARHDPWQPRVDGNWAIAPDVVGERVAVPAAVTMAVTSAAGVR